MEDIIKLFAHCGIPAAEAKIIIVFLQGYDGLTIRDIKKITGMCQSQVYDSIQALKEYGWLLDQQKIESVCHGRPKRVYFLGASPKKIIQTLEKKYLTIYNESLNQLHILRSHPMMS